MEDGARRRAVPERRRDLVRDRIVPMAWPANPGEGTMRRMETQRGFTLIEAVIVLAVVGVLALMAIPSLTEATVRRQVKEALVLADIAKAGVQAAYTLTGDHPPDNKSAGLP